MERFVQKETALLTPSSPSRDPDIDFNDVFGGPPKRSTSHESRYSFSEPTRCNSRTQENDDVNTFLPRNPWSGRRERPVFGEEMGSRRKHPSNDFYDDIFRGDETPVGSPRRASHEPFGSGPGSSVLSPTRPLPPRPDSFGTSLPAQVQFSLPAKLTRGMDSPSYSSGNSSKSTYKEPISNAKGFLYTPGSPLYKPSPLSHEVSLNSEVPSLTIKPEELKSPDAQTKVKNDYISTEKANEGNQFHFSIYKWASKGVPMLVPLRGYKSSKLKEVLKTEILSSLSETDLQDTKRNASTNNKVHHAEEIKQGKGSPNKTTNMKFQTVSIGAVSNDKREKIQAFHMDTQQDQTPELKSLRSFLGTSEAEGMSKTNKKSEKKEYMMKKTTEFDANADIGKTVQRRDEKEYSSKREEVIQVKEPQLIDSKRMSKESIARRKAKGNVDEFANIFNKEANLKPKIDTQKQNQSSERGFASIGKTYKETSAKVQQKQQTPANTPVTVDKKLEKLKKQHSHLKTSVSNLEGNSSDKKDDQASNSESHPDNTQDIEDDMDDLFNETFTVEEISIDQDKAVQADDNYEDIKTSDSRIRKWSRGKEGNIRSLLSTLQYVLWPGSGWKPVPLVDIIDASAVKRSYQRAMLCLHPDKLQQKGAADYQKYIAEKVFDILQEAWDQFNSLGLV